MSRRCLICANVNPCRKHSYDEQDAELARNDRAIRELKATPEAPMTNTLERREAMDHAPAWGDLPSRLVGWAGKARARGCDRIELSLETVDRIVRLAALTTSPRVDEGRAQIERECADLIARYYRREIGELMHQAEHWAENGKPFATHHRLHKADSYFQIVGLMERDPAKGWKLPFDEIRHQLARQPINPPGTYPPTAELHRFRDASFVAAITTTPADPRVGKIEADLGRRLLDLGLLREAIDRELGKARSRAATDFVTPQHQGQRGQDWDKGFIAAWNIVEAECKAARSTLSQIEGPATAAAFAPTEPPAPTP